MFTNDKSTMNLQDYTVAQLKELLKARNLSIMSNKADLMLLYVCKDTIPKCGKHRRGGGVIYGTKSLLWHRVPIEYYTRGRFTNHEFEFVRRERDLLRREIEI